MNRARGTGYVFQPVYTDRQTHESKTSAIWWLQYYVSGKRVRESSGSVDRGAAERLLQKKQGLLALGQRIGPDVDRTTLGDLAGMLAERYKADGQALQSSRMKHVTNFFGSSRRAKDITGDQITSFINFMTEKGWTPATINRSLAALKRSFNIALENERVARAPVIHLVRERNTRKGFFERDQLEAVIAQLPESGIHPWDLLRSELEPALRAAYLTGWRIREVLSRQKKHLDLANGILRLEPGETKNGEGREFPINVLGELSDLLTAQVERTRQFEIETGMVVPWLFHHRGQPIGNYRKVWRTACQKAGVPDAWVHDFRRSAVRNLIKAQVPQVATMQITGHLTATMFRRYAIIDSRDVASAVEKLNQVNERERLTVATPKIVPIR